MKFSAGPFVGDLLEYRNQNRWFVVILILVNLVVMGRLFQLQVVGGKKYERLAEINQVKRSRIPPRRGEIADRKGRLLATNVDLYKVTIIPHYVKDIDEELARLSPLLLLTDEEVTRIRERYLAAIEDKKKRFHEIQVKQYLNGSSCPNDGTLLEESPSVRYAWCKTCGAQFIPLTKDQRNCPFDEGVLEIDPSGEWATCPRCGRKFSYSNDCPHDHTPLLPVEHNLRCPRCHLDTSDTIALLRAHLHELDGVYVREEIVRAYPYGEQFAHVVGYVNEVNRQEIDAHPGVYRPKDYIGRRGIEKSMEEVLRGRAGEEVSYKDSRGRTMTLDETTPSLANLKYEPAVPGNNVVLTLDLEVQRVLEEELKDVESAGVVVLDVSNGEVLGIYSKPTFDPNDWAGRLTREKKARYDANPFYPMINKATTAFPPASTFKILTAIAGLNEGIVTPDTKFNCPGYYVYSGHRFGCYNKYGHGDLDLERALSVSCDVYFYRLGELLGMDRIEHYSVMLGLGSKTGVEIGEDTGLVPSRAWHERHSKGGFQPGFTLSTAVGQKDIRATPLQMAMLLAQVVNGGHHIDPFLVDRIEDEGGNVVRNMRKSPGEPLNIPAEYLEFIRKSMVGTIESDEGTGASVRKESIRFGAKTGTAEARQFKEGVDPYVARWLAEDHAWMIAFAPVETPRIAVACIVEHGGFGGSVAGPIVSDIIYRLFALHLIPQAEEEQKSWPSESEKSGSAGILP